ncbi:Oligopeptide ABC superfamily ATP binding cassette transporter, binding protein [Lactobacillus equicursoris DSM 19284 = JCM 14600 = CIP 110162]|uniref:Oligopeptide ABC superfamily ATP binding cassette transporter, binding protein n=1 Tax=Lactobacillus equicursoris DSM 19284 = JCM 14600 = CIP 110162 TaxID=1293597 RepID=K0NZ04_9LACO|nr:peptide ABC transporter substrate-binding protein [Lactobacillus equicursoris]KRL00673.1 oligopeptide ABC superfamily ATP binding cassette transporter, binding protein [Lactobacillus equicursoris DSM 19284 = JCM 14600 = CIP 110162]CCK85285.1 Oligopeptide ABC superfamily ATP binding cassette transporter, binding protein [Lactobacillus equicursoris DSM 19284 = JCM 14600 = CIP 110162]
MQKKKIASITLLAGAALFLAACGQKSSTNSSEKQVMNTAVTSEISTLDSSKYGDTTSSEILQNSMEGLYRFNSKGQAKLAGATAVSRSKDQKVYTFTLRKYAKWSNGDAVTAQDYVTAWRRTVDPKNNSLDSDSYQVIKNGTKITAGKKAVSTLGIKALGKYKLQVTLENPISYLPDLLTGAQFYPQDNKVVKKQGSSYGTSSSRLVYNGPFKVTGWTGSSIKWTLVKNKTYWNAESVHLTKLNYQVIKTTSTGLNLYKAGDLDYAPVDSDYVKQYQKNKDYHSKTTPTNGYMVFNLKRKTTGNVHVRRAISLGINRAQLVKTVLHSGKAATGLVASGFIYDANGKDYRTSAGKLAGYDLAEAKAEWAKAKKQLGKSKITIELLTSDMDASKRVGEYIQSDLMKNLPGLTVKLRSIPLKSRLADTTAHKFDMVYGTWQPSFQDPIDYLTIGGLFNLETDYKNKNFWKQINLAKTTYATQPAKRQAALVAAEKQLVQKDAFTAPLYQAGVSYLLNSKVKGFRLSPYGTVAYYWDVQIK